MNRSIALLALSTILLLPASRACSLEPGEVVVVANRNSQDSLQLAREYLQARGVPENNLVVVETTTGYAVSRDDYDTQILQPIRNALRKRDLSEKTRCLCLIWGMPVRVASGKLPDEAYHQYAKMIESAHGRLAKAQSLVMTVGKDFPKPASAGLTPLGDLFEKTPTLPRKLPPAEQLVKNLRLVIGKRIQAVDALDDPAKARIGWRQLMALQLESFGLEGLEEMVREHSPSGAPDRETLARQIRTATEKLQALGDGDDLKSVRLRHALTEILHGVAGAHEQADKARAAYQLDVRKGHGGPMKDASVDSELSLMWHGSYKLEKFLPNPLHHRQAARLRGRRVPRTMMTARLDGPTVDDARRMLRDSVATEKKGLSGKMYIDTGGPMAEYDKNLMALFAQIKGAGVDLSVTVDDKETVFPRGSCPDAALYVGWYSLEKYVPAFDWVRGAVGYHISSYDARSLRSAKSDEWCPQMIRNGVAATLGAVNEPYLGAFPLPQEFFPLLLTGKRTIVECYWRTCPMTSWRMTLIADPLYNPFKNKPLLRPGDLPRPLRPYAD
jgi:uncharacterized protein (TIGR03790 family)